MQDKPGYAVALLLMLGMFITACVMQPVALIRGSYGLCACSPEMWQLPGWLACILNGAGIVLASLMLILLNKQYALLKGSSILYASAFLIMTGANPWLTEAPSTAIILALVALVCLWILFSCYGQRNVTHRIFILFTFLSFGSMIQYAFVLLALVFMIGMSYMRVFRIKEILAMLCGLAAPYWIMLGFGIIRFDDFMLPSLTNLFAQGWPAHNLTGLLLLAGAGAVLMIVPAVLNYRTVFATNGRIRGCNGFVLLLGVACVWFILFDFNNMVAYMALLNMMAAIQVAHFYKHTRIRRDYLIPLVLTVVYLAIFIFILL